MNKRRLLKLAKLLEEDAKNKKGIKFDMSMWGAVSDLAKPASCRTTACAMGLAALSGAFKRQGLGYQIDVSGRIEVTMHGDGWGLPSAEKLFDLSADDAEYLFISADDAGAQGERAVARRIRKFVASDELR